MDTRKALDQAFSAGLKVRGAERQAIAAASLVMHAARTIDPEPFLERGAGLVGPAMESFRQAGRHDIELRVACWLSDGDGAPEVSAPAAGALRAYRGARAWAERGGGREDLAWTRDVPRDEEMASIVVGRLFDHALAAGEEGGRPAEAVLEAALADFPRPSLYGLVFRAAAVAGAPPAVDRTLSGLGSVHPTQDNPSGRSRLEGLRAALTLERREVAGETLEAAVESERPHVLEHGLAAHVAGALHRKRKTEVAIPLVEEARAGASSRGKEAAGEFAALAFVQHHMDGRRGQRASTSRRLMATRPGVGAEALVAGGCQAARAVRDAWPTVDVAQSLMGDSVGPLATASARAAFQRQLFAVGGEAAAATGDRAALDALTKTVRGGSLPPAVETYVRAILADAAAGAAARAGDGKAYDLALRLAGRSRDRFERAKMYGRVAMEFVRAKEVPPMPVRWLDPLFGALEVGRARTQAPRP